MKKHSEKLNMENIFSPRTLALTLKYPMTNTPIQILLLKMEETT